jgi:hypothetical protein
MRGGYSQAAAPVNAQADMIDLPPFTGAPGARQKDPPRWRMSQGTNGSLRALRKQYPSPKT